MDSLPGPLKPLNIVLPEVTRATGPQISHVPVVLHISEKHKWIVGALESGFKARDVAKMFDVTEEYVRQISLWEHPDLEAARQAARDRVSEALVDLTARIKYHADEALKVTVKVMREGDMTNKRLAAKDLMDRAGYSPVKKIAEVRTEVPSAEFVDAVKRMDEANEARDKSDQWKWKSPVATVPAPEGPQVSV